MRTPLLLCLLAASLPLAWAHGPAGTPNPACEDGSLHDYAFPGQDSLLGYVGPVSLPRPRVDGSLGNPACLGGDGHAEFGPVLYLAVESGDGLTSGSLACLGAPGHHTNVVNALDAAGYGPFFRVGADHSRYPPASGPDCGDGVIEECFEPGISEDPTPGQIITLVNRLYQDAQEGLAPVTGAGICTPGDAGASVFSNMAGPSVLTVPFGPGADGSYVVFTDPFVDWPTSAGHVWTT